MDITEKERWAAMEARLMERLDRLEAVLCRTSSSRSPSSSPTCSTTVSNPSTPTEAPSRSTVSTAVLVDADTSTTTATATPTSVLNTMPMLPVTSSDLGIIDIAITVHPQAMPTRYSTVCLNHVANVTASAHATTTTLTVAQASAASSITANNSEQAMASSAIAADVAVDVAGVLMSTATSPAPPNTTSTSTAPSTTTSTPHRDAILVIPVNSAEHPEVAPTRCSTPGHGHDVHVLALAVAPAIVPTSCTATSAFGFSIISPASPDILWSCHGISILDAYKVFEVLGDQSFVGDKRHWRGCKLPKPPWTARIEVAESWFEQKLLTDGFLLEASPWRVLSTGLILFSALHILKEVTGKEDDRQLLRIPVWIMSRVPWPILLCTRWELQHRMSWPPDRGEAACIRVMLHPRPCQLIKCSQHVVFVQLKAPWPPPRCMGLALIGLDVLLAPWPPPVLWGCMVLSFRAYIVFSPTAGTQLELWNIIIGHAHDEGCKKIVQCKSRITTFRAVEMGEQASVHNALEYLLAREGELSIQSGEKYLAGSSRIIVTAQVKCMYHKEKMWFELSDGFIVAHGSESFGARFWLAENSTDVKCRALFHGRIVWQQRDIFPCWAHDLPHSKAVFCRLKSVDYGAGLKRVSQNICKTMLDHTSIGDDINCSCITTLLTGQWPWDPGGYDNHPWFHWLMSKEAKKTTGYLCMFLKENGQQTMSSEERLMHAIMLLGDKQRFGGAVV